VQTKSGKELLLLLLTMDRTMMFSGNTGSKSQHYDPQMRKTT
jgi:hypothetical protein